MRVRVGAWLSVLVAGPVMAAPVPPPPDDFTARQYIDGAGCVFERQGHDWVPRLDKAGARICGFPATLSSRRTDSEADRILPLTETETPPGPEDLLIEALASGLRAGEFVADPRPAEPRRQIAKPVAQTELSRDLGDVVQQEATLRAAMMGNDPQDDLCAKLGYQPNPGQKPRLGDDVTLGLCAGMRVVTLSARIEEGARGLDDVPAATPSPVPTRPSSPSQATGSASATEKPGSQHPGKVATADSKAVTSRPDGSVIARRTQPGPTAAGTVEMIPATARYVQIGQYADDDTAQVAIRRLSDLGYRVSQTYARRDDSRVRVILAGPFGDRGSLVEALDHLRRSGYPRAVAR